MHLNKQKKWSNSKIFVVFSSQSGFVLEVKICSFELFCSTPPLPPDGGQLGLPSGSNGLLVDAHSQAGSELPPGSPVAGRSGLPSSDKEQRQKPGSESELEVGGN